LVHAYETLRKPIREDLQAFIATSDIAALARLQENVVGLGQTKKRLEAVAYFLFYNSNPTQSFFSIQ